MSLISLPALAQPNPNPVRDGIDSTKRLLGGAGETLTGGDTSSGGLEAYDTGGSSTEETGNPFNSGLREIPKSGIDSSGQTIPGKGQYANPFLWVMRTIMTLLTLVGIGTMIGIIYGGFLWMTSQGESSKVDKAKMTLRNSVIGLIIILSSYSITWWIVTQVIDTTAAFGGGFFLFNLF